MPKLSIIVPVYNTAPYLEKCLLSLVSQTLDDIEILIVNDGSTDNSMEIINKFKIDYPEKIVVLKKANGGLGDARNFALPYVKGEFIGFVDSDDFVEDNMFKTMYETALQNKFDVVECDFNWLYSDKVKKDIGINYVSRQDFFVHGRVTACNKIYKSSLILGNSITFPASLRYEDIEFFYKLVPYIKSFGLVPHEFYQYAQHDNSIINFQNEKTGDIFPILENILSYYKAQNLYENYQIELEYLYIRFLLGSSFKRITKIKNKEIKNKLLAKTWSILNDTFPNWKKNDLLKMKSKKNLYYKSINAFTFKIYKYLI